MLFDLIKTTVLKLCFFSILRLFFNETNLIALKRTVCFLKSPKKHNISYLEDFKIG